MRGTVELATGAETNTGTDATRAVTPDGLDDWTGSAQITTLGTIVTGVWNGTDLDADRVAGDTTDDDDLDVAAGGTGVSTLTDGGILIGNAGGDIVAAAVLANGEILIGDNATDPVAATITGGEGIGVTNGAGSITIDIDGSALTTTKTECVGLNAGGAVIKSTETIITSVRDGTNFPYRTYDFDDATDEFISWTYPLPDNIAGTTATVTIGWIVAACTATTADDICWQFDGGGFIDDQAFHTGALDGTATAVQDLCTTANDIMVTAATTWTHNYDVASPKDTTAVFVLNRDADLADAACSGDNNDVSGDAGVAWVRICYETGNIFSGEGG